MGKEVEDVEYSDMKPSAKDRFPRVVIVIILTEFCERFSYSGMRAFLTLYLRSKLGYTDNGATEIYHTFATFVYVFPIIGGILADNYLGKFRTILYMMFVYAAGNILVALTAIPQLDLPGRLCTSIGLFLITVGTGGIKPCVSAFGGDQFKLPEQDRHISTYFSLLYFLTCLGSLIAKTVSPILRAEVHCFGEKTCYSLAFGAPSLIIIASMVIFVSAKNHYVMKKPEGNIVIDFVKCIVLGIKNSVLKGREMNTHWLDSAQHHYDKRFIRDIKKTLSILMLFTVLPVFWSLLDQMGSRWTLQATKMDGRFGFVTIQPDQLQVTTPIFILIFIPTFQKIVYPFFQKRNMLKNALTKLTLGGILAGLAFITSGVVEIYLKTTYPQLPQPGYSQIRMFNGNPCSVSIHNDNVTYTIPSLSHYIKKDVPVKGLENLALNLNGDCIKPRKEWFLLEENRAVSFFLNGDNIAKFYDNIDKSKSGLPVVRFLISDNINITNITLYNEKRTETEAVFEVGVSPQLEVFASTYSIWLSDEIVMKDLHFNSGGVYTIVLSKDGNGYKSKLITITEANSITMALLLPQFIIMAIAEVLFGVTGYDFTFKESPESMKAVMIAAWLLTEAIGNVIIIVITRLFVNYQQETQSFIYTGLMFVSVTIFHFLARRYQFGPIEDDESMSKKKCRSDSEVLYLQVKEVEDCLDH